MKSFIDRNPKEKAVEEAFAVLACNGYESERLDPADNVFVVAEQLKHLEVVRGVRFLDKYLSTIQ